jgi:predicted TIM-barrel fold metal-dependent hydrolase
LAKQVPTFETSAGTGSAEQRLREQDQDGIDAEILYSQISFMFQEAKEGDLYRDLFRAYNEFLAQEYMAVDPKRLIPVGVIPKSGVDDAIEELQRCAKLGLKGVKLDTFPSGKPHPTPEDDKFWAAALDLNMPLTNHSDGKFARGSAAAAFLYAKEPGPDVHQREPMNYFFRFTNDAMKAATQMAFAGVWDRFPKLELYWAETMIGWLKYGLWQLDDHYDRYMPMIRENWGLHYLERKPSEYLKERSYWGFLHDPVGVADRDCVGADKLMWATDFAHAASEWPNSVKVMEKDFVGVPPDDRHAMLAGNAQRFFHLN